MKPSLIVHGGAWSIPDEVVQDCRHGCRRALEAGWAALRQGGSALDAVEAAIVVLEDEPVFDAGRGSHLNLDGRVELDAIVMEGAKLKAGAVAAVERLRHPIRLARRVLESSAHMMLVGPGAEQFAREQGMALCDPAELIVEREREAWARCRLGQHGSANHVHHGDTVGAVALDAGGQLAAGTSTGGTCCKHAGRVGDSPLIGCGCYADQEAGGVSCTGDGEALMKVVMAKTAVDMLRTSVVTATAPDERLLGADAGTIAPVEQEPVVAQRVAESCVQLLARRTQGTGGLILLDRHGVPGAAFNTSRMAWGCVLPDGSFFVTA
jgi:L-asparaginase / beta-aspartyl-peptidase